MIDRQRRGVAWQSRAVWVTGGTGFIGRHVCARLVALGADVVATSRGPDPGDLPAGVVHLRRDLAGPGPVPRVDLVVHAAGTVTDMAPLATMTSGNVATIATVLADVTVPVVALSTGSVYDHLVGDRRQGVHESAGPADPAAYRHDYAATKAAAEHVVVAEPRPWIILRPRAVYGPGDATLEPRMLAAIRAGRLAIPRTRAPMSLCHVDTLVDAVVAAAGQVLDGGPMVHRAINVADVEPVRLRDVAVSLLAARAPGARVMEVPAGLVTVLGRLGGWWWRLTGATPLLGPYAAEQLVQPITLDTTRLGGLLGHVPVRSVVDHLR